MKKLKQQYRRRVQSQYCEAFFWYPNLRSGRIRRFSTKQERSRAQLDEIEYKEFNLRVRARRGSGLINEWDELPSSTHDLAKCWKHNSRRRHQYFRQ